MFDCKMSFNVDDEGESTGVDLITYPAITNIGPVLG